MTNYTIQLKYSEPFMNGYYFDDGGTAHTVQDLGTFWSHHDRSHTPDAVLMVVLIVVVILGFVVSGNGAYDAYCDCKRDCFNEDDET